MIFGRLEAKEIDLNIAIVLMKYNPFGGYERQAAILAETMAKRGDNVTIFTNKWTDEKLPGIKFRKIRMIKLSSWLKVLSFALFSMRYLKREREQFDVIIAFDRTLVMDIYRAGNACHREWLNFRKKTGSISDFISIGINPIHPIINRIEKSIFAENPEKNADIVVLSGLSIQQIKRYYPVREERFVVIPPALDLNRFQYNRLMKQRTQQRASLRIDDDTLTLLHVGSGFRIKGLKNTIEALAILLKSWHNARLLVVGTDRDGTRQCRRLSKRLGIGNYVEFVGGVTDIGRFYATADIFVVPSLFETFCISAVEALAFGLPVIIGRGAGVSFMIHQDNIGNVIDVPADPYRLAELIKDIALKEQVYKSEGTIDQIRERRRTVAFQCDKEIVLEKFLSVIDEIAEKKRIQIGIDDACNQRYYSNIQ
jgi:UDP-glucose:(heptosyl)LPS alpha-1,3-glucosyltransferase